MNWNRLLCEGLYAEENGEWNGDCMFDNGFTENYPYVFAQGGCCGANQNSPKRASQKYAGIVRKFYPDDTDAQIEQRLSMLSTEGCGYAACINSIFLGFYGREEAFESVFHYPMFTPEGALNFDDLLVDFYCAMDNHNVDKGEDRLFADEDKNYPGGYGTTERSRKWRFEFYLKQHGVEAEIKQIKVQPEKIAFDWKEGPVLVNIRPNILYDQNGRIVWEKDVGHTMSVIGVAENGLLRVSSWGKEYYVKPGSYSKFETYQQVLFKTKKALLVVDMQEMTVGEGQDRSRRYPPELLDRVNEVIEKRGADHRILYISHLPKRNLWNRLVAPGGREKTPRTEPAKGLRRDSENQFTEYKRNAFSDPKLLRFLREKGIEQVELIGADSGGAVGLTALGACRAGLRVVVNSYAIGTVCERKWKRYEKALKKRGAEFV